ncbi:MAG: carbamoyl phosphate synthase small subunit [Eubacteriales bacterium]
MKKAYLVLEDGHIFDGLSFGADVACTGELVFTTGMCGYMETLTDPSYYGQIVLQTFPLIGNYGVIEEDFEGKCCVRGYVVREYCDTPSNFRAQYGIDQFLKNHGIPGIYGVDTRQVTKILRESGVMNAYITTELPVPDGKLKNYAVTQAVENVTVEAPVVYEACGAKKHEVILVDYGAKKNIIRELCKRGCRVTAVPASSSAEQILALSPDGLMLSNGPGDPAENVFCVEQLKKLLGKVPIFGICLGHQLLALANGGMTYKLKYGHRGVNQPVREVDGTRTYITSQNHGYAVVSDSTQCGRVSFVNANDKTCEGMDYPELKAFSVQFHPEACSGPKDTSFLFDRFVSMMKGNGNATE